MIGISADFIVWKMIKGEQELILMIFRGKRLLEERFDYGGEMVSLNHELYKILKYQNFICVHIHMGNRN